MKSLFFQLLYLSHLHVLLHFLFRRRLTIALYHGVDEERGLGIYNYHKKFLSPESFERQLVFMKHSYTPIPLDEAVDRLAHGDRLPDNALCITFDDGYRNFYTHAFPLLKKHGLPATVFLAGDFIEKQTPLWVDRLEYLLNSGTEQQGRPREEVIAQDRELRAALKKLPSQEKEARLIELEQRNNIALTGFSNEAAVYAPLSWEEVREMEAYGISFGAHTMSHPILTRLDPQQAAQEIKESLALVSGKTGSFSRVFCYPNGGREDFNPRLKQVVRDLGFSGSLTTLAGWNNELSDLFALRRMDLDNSEQFAKFVVVLSGVKHLLRRFLGKTD